MDPKVREIRPARMGKPWDETEITKLLVSIQNKIQIAEIASEHERTVGAIISFRRKLAADYYFKEKKTIEEIVGITGLTKEEVDDAIKMREIRIKTAEQIKECTESNDTKITIPTLLVSEVPKVTKIRNIRKIKPSKEELPTMAELFIILKDIQGKLNTLLEKVN